MASKTLELLIKVTDQASKQLEKIKGTTDGEGVAGLETTFTNLLGAVGAFSVVFKQVVGIVSDSLTDFNEYALGVNKLGEAFSLSTHEAETLMRAADAMGVSNDALFSSINKLAREGMGVGTDALRNLREAFLDIDDPAERATYLFGMVGAEGQKAIAPLLTMSNMEFSEFLAGMEEGARLTAEQVEQAQELDFAITEAKSSWEVFSREFAGFMAPAISTGLKLITGDLELHTRKTWDAIHAHEAAIEALKGKKTYDTSGPATAGIEDLFSSDGIRNASEEADRRRADEERGFRVSQAAEITTTRRSYGGGSSGGGGGIGNADLEELFEDLIEVLKNLPGQIKDAVERTS